MFDKFFAPQQLLHYNKLLVEDQNLHHLCILWTFSTKLFSSNTLRLNFIGDVVNFSVLLLSEILCLRLPISCILLDNFYQSIKLIYSLVQKTAFPKYFNIIKYNSRLIAVN